MMLSRISLLALAFGIVAPASAQWSVTILQPPESRFSWGLGGFGNTQVGLAGASFTAPSRAAIWFGSAGSFQSLHPAEFAMSQANGVDGSQAVGSASMGVDEYPQAILWNLQNKTWVNLSPSFQGGEAFAVCNGRQVGYANVFGDRHAALWSGSAASWVDLAPTAYSSAATAIDDDRQVGYVWIDSVQRATMWKGTATSRIDLNPLDHHSKGTSISGTNVGGMISAGTPWHAAMWYGSKESWVDFHPAGNESSEIRSISGNVQVGVIRNGQTYRAAYWNGTPESYVNLDSLIPQGALSSQATQIWSDGQTERIVGMAQLPTGYSAVIWSRPIPDNFSVALSKEMVAGYNSVLGTITMNQAKANPTTFNTYANSDLVATPATVTIPSGSTSASFRVRVFESATSKVATVFARLGTAARCQTFTMVPLVPSAMGFTPNPMTGPGTIVGRVVINGVAGPGGKTVFLSDNSPYAAIPPSVTILAGTSGATFNIPCQAVPSMQTVTVTAQTPGGVKTGTFRLYP